jgi:hypothetical protein
LDFELAGYLSLLVSATKRDIVGSYFIKIIIIIVFGTGIEDMDFEGRTIR